MNKIDPNQLLAQLRIAAAQAQGNVTPAQNQTPATDFSALLQQSLDKVNETQQTAGALSTEFEQGKTDVSLEQVMIAKQKANISFQAMLKVRNELISAYKEVMAMQV
jgi:flagellar hook-basal body complex protein FliE